MRVASSKTRLQDMFALQNSESSFARFSSLVFTRVGEQVVRFANTIVKGLIRVRSVRGHAVFS